MCLDLRKHRQEKKPLELNDFSEDFCNFAHKNMYSL